MQLKTRGVGDVGNRAVRRWLAGGFFFSRVRLEMLRFCVFLAGDKKLTAAMRRSATQNAEQETTTNGREQTYEASGRA